MKRLSKVKIEWSPEFAYAIGLLTTDGNLSPDQRHINMTSKDEELIIKFKQCLNLDNKIGRKSRGGSNIKKYFVIQFGDRNFYDFLLSVGLRPAKSKTLKSLKIPKIYFSDFLRGCIDGDGSLGTFKRPESRHPQLRVRLYSASALFLKWIKKEISSIAEIDVKNGWITEENNIFTLAYAKDNSIKLLNYIYYPDVNYYLERKYKIAKPFLRV